MPSNLVYTALRLAFSKGSQSSTSSNSQFRKTVASLLSQITTNSECQYNLPEKSLDGELSIFFPTGSSLPLLHETSKLLKKKGRSKAQKVLLIDDDLLVLDTIQTILTDLGYECLSADNELKANSLFKKYCKKLALVIVDAIMPGTEGQKLIRQFKRMDGSVPILGFSGADASTTAKLTAAGACDILRKPVGVTELKQALEKHCRKVAGTVKKKAK